MRLDTLLKNEWVRRNPVRLPALATRAIVRQPATTVAPSPDSPLFRPRRLSTTMLLQRRNANYQNRIGGETPKQLSILKYLKKVA